MPELLLPWESSEAEDRRYQRILRRLLITLMVFAVVIPWLPVPEPSRTEQEAVPAQLARVLLEKQVLPAPQPQPKPQPKPELKPEPEPEPKPELKPEPVKPEPAPPKAKPVPRDLAKEARELAAVSGVLAFQDTLAEMRDNVDVDSLNQQGLSQGQAAAEVTQRRIIAAPARAGSGGIQTAALSRDTGGPALSGQATTRVQSTITAGAAVERESASAALGGRSDESIRRTMDRNKGAIFAIYNRALRRDPSLSGKLVFEMEIEASGAIASLRLISSELADSALTDKLLARIRMIRFEVESVISTRVNYSFDFLPY
jgi:protein TonB